MFRFATIFGRVFDKNFRNISSKCYRAPNNPLPPFSFKQMLRELCVSETMGRICKAKVLQLLSRVWSGPNNTLAGKQAEQKMINILRNKFPKAQIIQVTDVSGGCGAMFHVNVVAPEFQGLNTVKQHRLINDTLKDEIKDMHGIRIETGVPRP